MGNEELSKHRDTLFPIILDSNKQTNELRTAAIGLLTTYTFCTGYVIEPYVKYPILLDYLLNRHSKTGSLLLDDGVMRCIGVLGAIDPFEFNRKVLVFGRSSAW